MARHRVPNLGGSLRHGPDPARSPDPEIRQLVSALATLELAPPPSPVFRAELRAQLVAVAPRLVAEGIGGTEPGAAPQPAATEPHRHRRAVQWQRRLAVAVSGFAVVAIVLTGLVLLGRSALPGTPLYGVKRATESVELSLTSGPVDKAKLYLHFATVRADEVSELLGRPTALGAGIQADAALNPQTARLVKSTLASADGDVQSASQLLTQDAVRSKSTAPLAILSRWAPSQHARLAAIAQSLPESGPLHAQAMQSVFLVQKAQRRAGQVREAVTKGLPITGGDELGPSPSPCADCALAPASTGSVPALVSPSQSAVPVVQQSSATAATNAPTSAESSPAAPPAPPSQPATSNTATDPAVSSASTDASSPDDSGAPSSSSPVASDTTSTPDPTTSPAAPDPTSTVPVSGPSASQPVQPLSGCDTATAPDGSGC